MEDLNRPKLSERTGSGNRAALRKGGPDRKLFFSVLLTYLLMLAVTLALLIVGYAFSIRQAERSAEDLQTAFLGQVRREMDLRFSSVTKINNMLASNPLTKSVAEKSDEKVEYQLVYRDLIETIMEQNSLLNSEGKTILYFFSSDSVFTDTYRYRTVNLDAFTNQLGLTPEEFRAFLTPSGKRGEFRILHPDTEDAELVYLEPVLNDSYDTVGTVMTRISTPYLESAINVSQWMEGSLCHMEYRDDFLFIGDAGKGDTFAWSERPDYEDVPLDASPVTTVIGGKKYMTVGLRSTVNSWVYYFSVPLEVAHRTANVYLILFVVFLCSSLLSGIVLSFIFSRRFSEPLRKILRSLQMNTAVAYPEAIASLERTLSVYRQDISAARDQLRRNSQQEKEDFLYALCCGNLTSEKLENGLEKYAIPLKDAPAELIVFHYLNMEQSVFFQDGFLDGGMLLYASRNMIEELLCAEGGAAVSHEGQTLCLYQPKAAGDDGGLQEILETISRIHTEALHVDLRVYCTGWGARLADLPELLSRAETMNQYKLFWDRDIPEILFYDETEELSDSVSSDSLGAEKRFRNLLAIKEYEGARQVLMEQLDTSLSKDLKRFQQERYRVYGMVSSLLEALSSLPSGLECGEEEKLNAALKGLLTAKSVGEVREKTDELFREVITCQERRPLSECPDWVQEVQSYIEAHYAEPQLDVSHLAEKFRLNVSYLSRTYKKYMSIGVLDNIHMVRIAKAKELLAKGVSVQQTSSRVGYMESRALIRTFKRYESMTPGQYQESLTFSS